MLKNREDTTRVVSFDIAGVRFAFNGSRVKRGENTVQPFLRTRHKSEKPPDIVIQLDSDNGRTIQEFPKLYEIKNWSVFQEANGYFFLSPASNYCIRTNADFTKLMLSGDIKFMQESISENLPSRLSSLSLVRMLLMYYLAQREGALLHAAALDINGAGYVFPGRSGAGKSTLSQQFLARKHGKLLNDEQVVVRKIDTDFMVFGTPWSGSVGTGTHGGVPLAGMFFITQATTNAIKELTSREILEKLLPTVAVPWSDRDIMLNILGFCENLISDVPAHELLCTPTVEVVDALEQFIAAQ